MAVTVVPNCVLSVPCVLSVSCVPSSPVSSPCPVSSHCPVSSPWPCGTMSASFLTTVLSQVSSCPIGTEAASLDIAKAYRNSPIAPCHKKYLCVLWKGLVYMKHIAIEGLATAGGIQ